MKKSVISKLILFFITGTLIASAFVACESSADPEEHIVRLNEDTSWCWFQDERALIDGNQLLFTGVTSEGANTVTSYNMKTGNKQTVVINDTTFQPDDHNVGALLVRPDGQYLTVYAGHGVESKMRYRISTKPGDISQWEAEETINTGGSTTYSNIYRLGQTGKIYNFHRGIDLDPNYMVSENGGESWQYGGKLFSYPGRPYMRYTSNGVNRVHFITTERHPRYYDNGIYHGYIEYDYLFESDGGPVGKLSQQKQSEFIPQHFTRVFVGDTGHVAWTSDIELDSHGYPYIAFSVTRDPLNREGRTQIEEGGFDHRYHYARWDGKQWHEYEIAYAGTRLYPSENEYTGNIALHPENLNVVYVSADVHPASGKPLLVDGERRYEIFRGMTIDQGTTWQWKAITENSEQDNIRPIVVADEDREVVLWLNGRYTTYKDYKLTALARIFHKK